MDEIKTWEEATRLKKAEIIRIILYILNAILDIIIAIMGKNIVWVVCGLLWITISITEYFNLKIKKSNETLIDLLEKRTEIQKIIIDALLDESAVEVEMSKIKIPEYFSKPNKNKLQERFKYYKENNKFKTPIVIDTNYNLIDGYTSYLIAKKYNKTSVIAKMKRSNKKEKENV